MARYRERMTVAELRGEVNRLLALPDSGHVNADFRRGVAALLETFLHNTGNYRGFNYVKWNGPAGHARWVDDGRPEDKAPYLGDQTQREYY